jgi:hypothetical protein
MNEPSANPIFVALLFILRCVAPLVVLFGISYLLRKMGLVAVETPEPPDDRSEQGAGEQAAPPSGSGSAQPAPIDSIKNPTVEPPRSRSK